MCLPSMHKGFLANLSLPLHPLYRQQHPAAQILKANSAPKMKMAKVSCIKDTKYVVSLETSFSVILDTWRQLKEIDETHMPRYVCVRERERKKKLEDEVMEEARWNTNLQPAKQSAWLLSKYEVPILL